MKKRKAVYAASLDPITNGHINIIERMAPLYDELVVMIAVDLRKAYTFTPEERVNMVKESVSHFLNVTVNVCIGHYVVNQANSIGAQVIIRGLRSLKDLEEEQTLAEENRKICPFIETVLVPCLPNLMHVSSSIVKGHVGADPHWEDQVARLVPAPIVIKLKEKFILQKARKHWMFLMSELGNPKGSEEVLKDLLSRYGEPHRAYHNLEHIVTMLDELEQLGDVGTIEIRWAIWHHDSVYNPKAKDNEEQSATLSKNTAKKLGLPDTFGDRESDLILSTKHGKISPNHDNRILADLDLVIFGKSEKEFDAYEAAIQKEYEFVPRHDFCLDRSEILRSFLDRPSIYLTDYFRDKYKSAARKNLKRSIGQLKK